MEWTLHSDLSMAAPISHSFLPGIPGGAPALEQCGSVWLKDYEEGLLKIEDLEQAKKAYF